MIKDLFSLIKKQKYNEIIKKIQPKTDEINFNFKFENESYFLEYVIDSKNINLIKEVLKKNISIDIIDSNGNSILYNLIKFDNKNSLDIIKLLLEKNQKEKTYGINLIDKQDIHGRTCFFYCVLFNNTSALDLIISYHLKSKNKLELSDLENIKDKNGDNILSYCFKTDRIKFINKILNIDYNFKSETNNNGENILHLSILTFSLSNIEYILKLDKNKKIEIDYSQKTYDDGFTPLQLFITKIDRFPKDKISGIINYISQKSNLFEQDNEGNNILHQCINEMDMKNLQYFIKEVIKKIENESVIIDGNFFNFTNIYGYTPLHLLIESIRNDNSGSDIVIENIKLLIENTEVNLQNIYGDSIIHQLLKKNLFIQYSKYLENKEINIFIENKKNITPFELIKNYKSDSNIIIMETIYKSYYNTLQKLNKHKNESAYSFKKLEKWEIECSQSKLPFEVCLKNIKEIIFSKNNSRSIPKERVIKYDFDSGIAINNCFFTGYQIDTLFGLLLLKEKFDVKLIMGYPLTINNELESLYSDLGLDYIHEFNFNNIMIYWVYQKIIFTQNFDEKLKEYYENKDTVIIPIGIEISNGAHTNILFCDFKNNIVERFEPNGSNAPINFNYNSNLLDKILKNKFQTINSNIKYLSPKEFLPNIGFSIIENIDSPCKNIGDPNGFCSVWCIWYCYQKLSEKENLESKEMVKYLIKVLKLQNKNFKTVIRNFSKNISSLRDRFLSKYNMDINDWISYNYTEDILIKMEKDIVRSFSLDN